MGRSDRIMGVREGRAGVSVVELPVSSARGMALLVIIVNHFHYPTNALSYTKLKRLTSTLYKSLKDTKLKITPTCFGSYVIHHQGVQSCA